MSVRNLARVPYVELTREQLAHAEQLADIWQQRVRDKQIPSYYVHEGDESGDMRNLIGAIAEVAYRLMTSRPLISPMLMAATYKLADVDGFAVKGTKSPAMNLLLRNSDNDQRADHHSYAVVFFRPPAECWLVGVIEREKAWQLKRWGAHLPKPSWLVDKQHLVDYVGPPPPMPCKGWRPPTDNEIFRGTR